MHHAHSHEKSPEWGDAFQEYLNKQHVPVEVDAEEGERNYHEWAQMHMRTHAASTTPHDPFEDILDEMSALHNRKGQDYGGVTDPYANVRASEEFGVEPWIGAYIRAEDKSRRIKSFIRNGRLENESLEDSLLDRCVYDVIALVLWREAHKK